MHLKMSSAKWRLFLVGLNVLTKHKIPRKIIILNKTEMPSGNSGQKYEPKLLIFRFINAAHIEPL